MVQIILISSCEPDNDKYKNEDILIQCFYQTMAEEEIDIKKKLNEIEQILISFQILTNASAESYVNYLDRVVQLDDWSFNDPNLAEHLISIEGIPLGIACNDSSYILKIDTTNFISSRMGSLAEIMMLVIEGIEDSKEFTPKLVANEILKHFNQEDFDHEFYRSIALIALFQSIKSTNTLRGIRKSNPPPELTKKDPSPIYDSLKVLVTGHDEILVDGTLISLPNLKKKTKEFLRFSNKGDTIDLHFIGKQSTSNAIVCLQNEKGTSYNSYIAVQNALKEAYDELKNEYSQNFFKTEFKDLNEEEKKIINKILPQRIAESR